MLDEKYSPLLDFNIIHGRTLCSKIIYSDAVPVVSISDDIHIITVINDSMMSNALINSIKFKKGKINYIIVDKYIKWISKIESIKNYLTKEYDNLPDYILYIDGFDVLILKDILFPEKYLQPYNCKILFNVEPGFWHTGFPSENNYFDPLYNDVKKRYIELNEIKYGKKFEFGLNAGVFLGRKDYVLFLMNETYNIMIDDISKGFPYGCMDDQCALRYMINLYYDDISVDVFNLLTFWGCDRAFVDGEMNELKLDYFKTFFKGINYNQNIIR